MQGNPEDVLVLGIESSCDETAVAVVRGGKEILSNEIFSQASLHAEHGGVVPELAGRSHLERILPLVQRALEKAGVEKEELGGIAVTNRPGLIGCLLVGLSVAKTLALSLGIPLIGVDHIQAHIHASFLADPGLKPPLVVLVASGGHTSLYSVEREGEGVLLGQTRDDAAGEALDKAAAMLGLGYPGGPAIEKAAQGGDPSALALPRGTLDKKSLDLSFSGLKTSLLYHLRGPGIQRPFPELSGEEQRDLAASFQEAVMDTLCTKLERAALLHPEAAISVGGGVAANKRLREKIAQSKILRGRRLAFPPLALCGDNAAMIAGLGHLLLSRGERSDLGLEARARSRAQI
ncbi:MAG TPA: tRNA (adenosine(37)-N6)-threonylcarbamoyltransferase complex transferase subunit TsaD [Planctomycetes bacterium]|nr:tRNA (adenosine(37)-N6)-threonylcarbamoyltransferase complex transferase subunit TsaD [Planctomycetota bacterium]